MCFRYRLDILCVQNKQAIQFLADDQDRAVTHKGGMEPTGLISLGFSVSHSYLCSFFHSQINLLNIVQLEMYPDFYISDRENLNDSETHNWTLCTLTSKFSVNLNIFPKLKLINKHFSILIICDT